MCGCASRRSKTSSFLAAVLIAATLLVCQSAASSSVVLDRTATVVAGSPANTTVGTLQLLVGETTGESSSTTVAPDAVFDIQLQPSLLTFAIVGSRLRISTPANYVDGGSNVHVVMVRGQSAALGLSATSAITVTVVPDNELYFSAVDYDGQEVVLEDSATIYCTYGQSCWNPLTLEGLTTVTQPFTCTVSDERYSLSSVTPFIRAFVQRLNESENVVLRGTPPQAGQVSYTGSLLLVCNLTARPTVSASLVVELVVTQREMMSLWWGQYGDWLAIHIPDEETQEDDVVSLKMYLSRPALGHLVYAVHDEDEDDEAAVSALPSGTSGYVFAGPAEDVSEVLSSVRIHVTDNDQMRQSDKVLMELSVYGVVVKQEFWAMHFHTNSAPLAVVPSVELDVRQSVDTSLPIFSSIKDEDGDTLQCHVTHNQFRGIFLGTDNVLRVRLENVAMLPQSILITCFDPYNASATTNVTIVRAAPVSGPSDGEPAVDGIIAHLEDDDDESVPVEWVVVVIIFGVIIGLIVLGLALRSRMYNWTSREAFYWSHTPVDFWDGVAYRPQQRPPDIVSVQSKGKTSPFRADMRTFSERRAVTDSAFLELPIKFLEDITMWMGKLVGCRVLLNGVVWTVTHETVPGSHEMRRPGSWNWLLELTKVVDKTVTRALELNLNSVRDIHGTIFVPGTKTLTHEEIGGVHLCELVPTSSAGWWSKKLAARYEHEGYRSVWLKELPSWLVLDRVHGTLSLERRAIPTRKKFARFRVRIVDRRGRIFQEFPLNFDELFCPDIHPGSRTGGTPPLDASVEGEAEVTPRSSPRVRFEFSEDGQEEDGQTMSSFHAPSNDEYSDGLNISGVSRKKRKPTKAQTKKGGLKKDPSKAEREVADQLLRASLILETEERAQDQTAIDVESLLSSHSLNASTPTSAPVSAPGTLDEVAARDLQQALVLHSQALIELQRRHSAAEKKHQKEKEEWEQYRAQMIMDLEDIRRSSGSMTTSMDAPPAVQSATPAELKSLRVHEGLTPTADHSSAHSANTAPTTHLRSGVPKLRQLPKEMAKKKVDIYAPSGSVDRFLDEEEEEMTSRQPSTKPQSNDLREQVRELQAKEKAVANGGCRNSGSNSGEFSVEVSSPDTVARGNHELRGQVILEQRAHVALEAQCATPEKSPHQHRHSVASSDFAIDVNEINMDASAAN